MAAGLDRVAGVERIGDGQAERSEIRAIYLHQPKVDAVVLRHDQVRRQRDCLGQVGGLKCALHRVVVHGQRIQAGLRLRDSGNRVGRDARRALRGQAENSGHRQRRHNITKPNAASTAEAASARYAARRQ